MSLNIGKFPLGEEGEDFIKRLSKLVTSGATVTVLVGGKPRKFVEEYKAILKEMIAKGIKLYHHRNTHAKFIIVEGKGNSVLVTSANYTKSGCEVLWEVGVYFPEISEDIYNKYIEYFRTKVDYSTPLTEERVDEWNGMA
jgi:phosphatidylserine/phosphatidylglycerophosphate/cardiolipin synthase-like enzyme